MTDIVIWYKDKNGHNKSQVFSSDTKDFELCRKGISSIDLSQFIQYPQIELLDLVKNKLVSIDLLHLSNCVNLHTLYISFNELQDVDLSPLHTCSKLKRLSLRKNSIKSVDISPLFFCLNLRELKVDKDIILIADSRLKEIEIKPVAIVEYRNKIRWEDDLMSDEMIGRIAEFRTAIPSLPIDTIAL